jgi:hypothetical protein
MDALAPITRRLIAPAWAVWERSPYLRRYRRLLRTQFDSPEVIRQRQWETIVSLLDHAYRTTRFWRGRLDVAGLEPGRICWAFAPSSTATDADGRRVNEVKALKIEKTVLEGLSVVTLLNNDAVYRRSRRTLEKQEKSGFFSFIPVEADKRGWNAATALNHGIDEAKTEWVICAHQDVLFPISWLEKLMSELSSPLSAHLVFIFSEFPGAGKSPAVFLGR